ncbi:MAG TPA: cytochrome c peroxidase, partial [Flavisolibacter sp.]
DQLRKEILFEISSIVNRIHHLQALVPEIELTESNILDALKLHLYRIITKGITGFDSPVAGNSIAELQPSLGGIKTALAFFKDTKPLIKNIDAAMAYVKQGGNDFNAFNRAVFIAQYLNPISTALNSYQKKQRIPFTQEERALRPDANTLFEASAWQPLFYAPSGTSKATARQIALGKKLFAEPLLSANGKRSCASCHNPQKAFTDGLALNVTLSGSGMLLRNTPTLYNASLQSAQFYDSRISFLEDQIHDVVSNQQEMNGQFASIVKVLEQKNSYKQLFCAAFADKNISADNIRAAVAAYVRSLVLLNSPFDQFMRGNRKGMNAEQVAGFNLFAGKAKCATYHFIPLFSGSVPPLFDKMESEVLGVPANKDTIGARMDADSGKYALYKIPHHLFSFKTPSLRNVTLTAPYMHNGVYTTLEEVIDFYDRGGGAGLGIELPNQTLPGDRLDLTAVEKKQIIAFLHALKDTGKQ